MIIGYKCFDYSKQIIDGCYGSCPLTSPHTVMFADFSYVGKVTPSFPCLDPRKTDLYSGGVTYWFSLVILAFDD
ncbi:MAG: hypothetical protein RIS10_294 [Pseudomonadota bacterium]